MCILCKNSSKNTNILPQRHQIFNDFDVAKSSAQTVCLTSIWMQPLAHLRDNKFNKYV